MDPSLSWHEHAIEEAALVVEVRGPLLFPESRVLGERLAVIVRGGVPQLVLDLSEVTELDAALVGLLLASARQLGWGGGRLTVVTQDPRTISMLATTGLDATVKVAPTQTDALRHIAAVPSVARVLVAT